MFVDRDALKNLTAVFHVSQFTGQEQLPDDDPDVVAFFAALPVPIDIYAARLAALEANMAAVLAVPSIKAALAKPVPNG